MSDRTIVVGAGSAGSGDRGARHRARRSRGAPRRGRPRLPRPRRASPPTCATARATRCARHDWGYRHRPTAGQVLFAFSARARRRRLVGGQHVHRAARPALRLRRVGLARARPSGGGSGASPRSSGSRTISTSTTSGTARAGPIPIRRHPRDELVPVAGRLPRGVPRRSASRLRRPQRSRRTTGVGPHAMNKIDGERMSAARCYLGAAVRRRANLAHPPATRSCAACAQEPPRRRARGRDRRARRGPPTRPVVLSAGAIATPGHPAPLRHRAARRRSSGSASTSVADVPAVGARLLDHPGAARRSSLPRRGVTRLADPLIQTTLRYTSTGSEYPNDMQLQPGSFISFPLRSTLPVVGIATCCVGKPRGHGSIVCDQRRPARAGRASTRRSSDRRRTTARARSRRLRLARPGRRPPADARSRALPLAAASATCEGPSASTLASSRAAARATTRAARCRWARTGEPRRRRRRARPRARGRRALRRRREHHADHPELEHQPPDA